MNAKAFIVLLCCATSLLAESAKVKQATGSVIRSKGKIQTGSASRIELELPYLAVVRIGSNANFKFSGDAKKMSLKSGTMLLSMPEKLEGVSVEAGSIVTTMVQGDLEMSNVDGAVKVVTLNGKVRVALAANPSDRRSLRAGDMIDVPAGAMQMPKVTAIKLSTLLKTSVLFNMGPLPTSRAIRQNATKQAPPRPFVTGGFDPDWGGGQVSLLATIGPAGTAAMVGRMDAGKPVPPPPVIAAGAIPTQAQVVALEANNLPVPNVSRADAQRILRGDPRIRQRLQERLRPPIPVATPAPTRPPVVIQPPIATPPPVISPPIATPRPTPRPPIAVP